MEIMLPQSAAQVIEILEKNGFEAWAVGGCVRDSLLGQTPKDWDIATNALPEQTSVLFRGCTVAQTGEKHGTVTVVLQGQPLEVTTNRNEGGYEDNPQPRHVGFNDDIHRDLKRRDFTINAMAYHPRRGLIDDFGGRTDLARSCIRCVGSPEERFREDALRIMRALRFSAVLGFEIDADTAAALRKGAGMLHNIAAERIRDEPVKLLCGKNVRQVLTEYRDVFAAVMPQLAPMFDFDQKNPHHYLDVWAHTVQALSSSVPVPAVRLALLFHDSGKPASFTTDEKGIGHFYGHPAKSEEIAREIMQQLRFDHATADRVLLLVRWHDADILPEGRSVKRWLNRLGEEGLRQLLQVKAADRGATNYKFENLSVLRLVEQKLDTVLQEGQCFSREKLAVNGKDLLALGFPQGRQLGEALDALLNLVIDEQLPNQRTVLLNRAGAMLADDRKEEQR